MSPNKLNGWPAVRLREVATIERKAVLPENITTGTTYVGLEHIDGSGDFVGVGAVEAGELASAKFCFGRHHVLYGKLRPYLRKTARPDFDGVCSTDILPILPGPRIDRNYLFHYLRQPGIVEMAAARCSGANLPRLSPKILGDFTIHLPPLPEQLRISEILDRADGIRRKRRSALDALAQFLRASFMSIFGDPATNPWGFPLKPIGSLGEVITGSTPSRANPAYYGPGIEWIKSDNINLSQPFLSRAEESLSHEGQRVGRVAPAGAILVTCITGSRESIGKVALADRPVAFNQQINAIVPNNDVNSFFLYVQLLMAKRLIQQASTDGMKGLVSKSKLSAVKLMCPPKKLQEQFGALFLRFNALLRKGGEADVMSHELFEALSAQSFHGVS